jgi:hypothetical protein
MSVDARMREGARRTLSDGHASPIEAEGISRLGRSRAVETAPTEQRASIDRLTIDVRIEDRVEAVTLLLRDGELAWSCTDGSAGRENGGPPGSAHVREALRFLAGYAPLETAESAPGTRVREVLPASAQDETSRRAIELGAALDALVTSVVRAGISGRESPSVRDCVEQLTRSFSPVPTALARFVGRLERAMVSDDARLLARLLDGAARASEDLQNRRSHQEMRTRLGEWLGTTGEVERFVDREMVEIARETLDGVQRDAIERRYLIDLTSGEISREERARGGAAPSIGPCPRRLFVGLGEVERGPAPRRVRILQYTATLEIGRAERERIQAHALRRVSMWVDAYRAAITAAPALAEPVQIIACGGVEDGRLVDAHGEPIPIATGEDQGVRAALDIAMRTAEPEWLVGRLIDTNGAIRMVPCSLGSKERIVRLR